MRNNICSKLSLEVYAVISGTKCKFGKMFFSMPSLKNVTSSDLIKDLQRWWNGKICLIIVHRLFSFLFSYYSLSSADRKRLELDEDRLLAVMLYNLIAFMILMRVSKEEIRRKIRRILGRCHIGLTMSQQVNELLDHITSLVKEKEICSTRNFSLFFSERQWCRFTTGWKSFIAETKFYCSLGHR